MRDGGLETQPLSERGNGEERSVGDGDEHAREREEINLMEGDIQKRVILVLTAREKTFTYRPCRRPSDRGGVTGKYPDPSEPATAETTLEGDTREGSSA